MDNIINAVADNYQQRDSDYTNAWGNYLQDQEARQGEQQAVAQKLQAAHAAAQVPTDFEVEAKQLAGEGTAKHVAQAVGTGAVETGKAVVGALGDAANAIIDLPFAATDFVKNNFFDYHKSLNDVVDPNARPEGQSPWHIPTPAKSEYLGAQVGRNVLQFLVPFSQAAKLVKLGQAVGATQTIARGAAAGAATDFAAFDGHDERLANILQDYVSKDNSPVSRAILDFFAADPNDSQVVGRMKNALEGAMLGVGTDLAVEGAMKVIKGAREFFRAKNPGVSPKQTVEELAQAHQAKAEMDEAARASDAHKVEEDAVAGQKLIDAENAKTAEAEAKGVEAELHAARQRQALEEGTTADEVAHQQLFEADKAKAREAAADEADMARMEGEGGTQAYVHPSAPNEIHMAHTAPEGALGLDPAVFRSLRNGAATAEDMPAVFTYRRAQEALFPQEAEAAAAKTSDVVAQVAETNKAVKALAADTAETASKLKQGEFAYWEGQNGEQGFGEILKIGDDGRYFVRDEETGKRSWKTAEQLNQELEGHDNSFMSFKALTGAAAKIGKLSEALGRGNIVAGATGAAVTATDAANAADGTTDTVIGAGLIGALGGVGIYKGAKALARLKKGATAVEGATSTDAKAASKTGTGVGTPAAEGVAKTERAIAQETLATSKLPQAQRLLNEPKLKNVSPVRPQKSAVQITPAQVDSFAKIARSGDIEQFGKDIDTAAFNYDYIDKVEDVKGVMDSFAEAFNKQVDSATRGRVSFEEIDDYAGMIGANPKSVHELYKDTGYLAERFQANRAFMLGSALHFRELAQAAATGDDLAILALKKHTAVHAAIQAEMKGTQTEVARALAAMRMRAGPEKMLLEQIDGMLTAHGGVQVNKQFAQLAAEMTDVNKLNKMAQRGWYARTTDALRDIYMNSALSGAITHVSNFTSNLLTLGMASVDKMGAVGIGAIRKNVFKGADDAMESQEVIQHLAGMWGGTVDALRITAEGRRALKRSALLAAKGDLKAAEAAIMSTDEADLGKVYKAFASDTQQFDRATAGTNEATTGLSAATFNADPNKFFGNAVDVLGALIRTPGGRMLTTSDELFKAVNHRGELYAQAYRAARAQGLEGEELARGMAHLIENPTDEITMMAQAAARDATFTGNLGKLGRYYQAASADSRNGLWILTPFVRTPMNIMHYAFKRSPLTAFAYKQVREDFAAGGIKRDMVVSKITTGSLLMGATALLAMNGGITGGGPRENQAEKLGGWQAYSVKTPGGKYYAYNRLDPFGMMMGWAADLVQIGRDKSQKIQDNLAGAMTLALANGLLSKSYLSGLVDAFDAVQMSTMSGNVKPLSDWFNSTAATFVPARGLRRTLKNELDPIQKEVDGIVDQVMKDTPLLSKYSPDAYNVFGEKQEVRKGLFGGPNTYSPVAASEENQMPAHKEVMRLNVDLKKPARSLNGAGNGLAAIPLDAKQYSRYIQLAGNEAKVNGKGFRDAINELVQGPSWKNTPEGDGEVEGTKEHIIRTLQGNYRKVAEQQLVKEFPDLARLQMEQRVKLIKARTQAPQQSQQ